MGYRDTKQEGPAAYAVSALISLHIKRHGLNDVQGLSIFSELARRTPETHTQPTKSEWKQFLTASAALVDASGLSPKRTASLRGRLEQAATALPSIRVWFALTNLDREISARVATLNAYLAQIARINGRQVADVTEEFWTRVAAVGTARSNGDGRETRLAFHGHVPSDFATIKTLTDMRREAVQAADITTITHTPVAHGIVTSYGYDEATERLEVNMAGSVYAYRVPRHVVDEIVAIDHSTDEVGSFISRTVFANPDFHWEQGVTIRICPACSNAVTQTHICHGPASAPYAEGVLVDLDPGAERIAADGTVLVLLHAPGARAQLVQSGSLTAPVVVITAPDVTADTFGGRHVITGEVQLSPEVADASALVCSCPAVACSHPQIAAEQVRQMVLFGIVPDATDAVAQAA